MRIVQPQPALSPTDKELLVLIARLVASFPMATKLSNSAPNTVPLSDDDAAELCNLLTDLLSRPNFAKGTRFAEMMADPTASETDYAREEYLSGRAHAGRRRVMASRQWADFRARLGLSRLKWGPSVNAMPVEQFEEMEKRLLQNLKLHPALVRQIRLLINAQVPVISRLRSGEHVLRRGDIFNRVRELRDTLEAMGSVCVERKQLVGIATVVVDVSVLFSTRDWSVAGTLSTIAGGVAMCVPNRQ